MMIISFIACKNKRSNINKNTVLYLDEKKCEDGKSKAVIDFNNGIYKSTSFGLQAVDDWEFEKYYHDYIKEKYNIEVANGGCTDYTKEMCYAEKMQELIVDKFSDTIFIYARKKAKIQYKKEPKKKKGRSLYKFDIAPEFIGGKKNLNLFIANNLVNANNFKGRIYVSCIIEKNGAISNLTIRRNRDAILPIDNEVINLFKKMPKWKPAIYHNENIKTRIAIPIDIK